MSDCATPATWSEGVSFWVCVKLLYVKLLYVRDAMWQSCECVSVCVWHYCMLSFCVWSYCMSEMLCDKICVCECVCEVIVCERCYVTKFVCVCEVIVCEMWQSCVCECVWSYCMWSYCMWEMLCDKVVSVWVCVREAAGGGGEGARDTESKTKTPHKVVGK